MTKAKSSVIQIFCTSKTTPKLIAIKKIYSRGAREMAQQEKVLFLQT